MSKSRLLSGASVNVYINGKDWGFVTGLTLSMATPRTVTHSIDTMLPWELVPNVAEVSGTVKVFRVIGDGGLEMRNVTNGFYHIHTEPYFTVLLKERLTGAVLFKADYCSIEGQQWDFESKSIVTGSFAFKGLTWSNDYTAAP